MEGSGLAVSGSIETRIVEMQFENSQFEKGVSKSLESLEQLKKGLDFKDYEKGLESLQKTGDSFSLARMAEGVEEVSEKFSTLGIIGIRVLQNLTDKAMDAGQRFVKSVSIDQINKGFTKYADKTKAVQTIVNATGLSMEEVDEQLAKLAWFTDETSYNFTDMVSNIGKFTSMNIPLDTSVTAMQGIATWAAASGQGINEASRAMYNLSQAVGAGYVKLIDWKSISNANMATAEFKQTAIDTAIALGTLKKSSDVTVANFESTLSKGWFTKDVLIETLQQYGEFADEVYALTDLYGISTAEAMEMIAGDVMSLGEKSFRAAQEAKTFTEAIEAVKDAVSTGWMNTFENIFGNYEEARVLWTDLANDLWEIFASGGNDRNKLLEEWKEIGGRKDLITGLTSAMSALMGVIEGVKTAFHKIFPETTVQDIMKISSAVKKLGMHLESLFGIRSYDKVITIKINPLGDLEDPLKRGSKGDEVKALQERLNSLGAKLKTDGIFGPKTEKALNDFKEKYKLSMDGVYDEETHKKLGEALVKNGTLLQTFQQTIEETTEYYPDGLKVIVRLFTGLFAIVRIVVNVIKGLFKIGKKVLSIFSPFLKVILVVAGAVSDFFTALAKGLENFSLFEEIANAVSAAFEPLAKIFESVAAAILEFLGLGGDLKDLNFDTIVKTKILDPIKDFWDQFNPDYKGKRSAFVETLLSMGAKLRSAYETISQWLGKIKKAISTFLFGDDSDTHYDGYGVTKDKGIVGQLSDYVDSIIQWFGSAGSTALGTIALAASTFYTKVKEYVFGKDRPGDPSIGEGGRTPGLVDKIPEYIGSIIEWFNSTGAKVLGDIALAASTFYGKAKKYIFGEEVEGDPSTGEGTTKIPGLIDKVVEVVTSIINWFGTTGSGYLERIKSAATTFYSDVKKFIFGQDLEGTSGGDGSKAGYDTNTSGLVGKVLEVVKSIIDWFGTTGADYLEIIKSAATTFYSNVKKFIFGDSTESGADSHYDGYGVTKDNGLLGTIKDYLLRIARWFGTAGLGFIGVIALAASGFYSQIKKFIFGQDSEGTSGGDGSKAGYDTKTPGLVDKVVEVVKSIIDWFGTTGLGYLNNIKEAATSFYSQAKKFIFGEEVEGDPSTGEGTTKTPGLVDKVVEVVKSIIDWFGTTGADYLERIKSAATTFYSDVKKFIFGQDSGGDGSKAGYDTNTSGLVGKVVEVVKSIIDWFGTTGADYLGQIASTAAGFYDRVKKFIFGDNSTTHYDGYGVTQVDRKNTGLIGQLSNYFEAIRQFVEENVPKIVPSIEEAAKTLWGALGTLFSGTGTGEGGTASNRLEEVFLVLNGWAGGAWDTVTAWLETNGPRIGKAIGTFVSSVLGGFATLVTGTGSGEDGAAANNIEKFALTIREWIDKIISAVTLLITGNPDDVELSDSVEQTLMDIHNFFEGVKSAIRLLFGDESAAEDLPEGVVETIKSIREFISTIITTIKSLFGSGGDTDTSGIEQGVEEEKETIDTVSDSIFGGNGLLASVTGFAKLAGASVIGTGGGSGGTGGTGGGSGGGIKGLLAKGGIAVGLFTLITGVRNLITDLATLVSGGWSSANSVPLILQMAEFLESLGTAIGVMVAAVVVLGLIPEGIIDKGVEKLNKILNKITWIAAILLGGEIVETGTDIYLALKGKDRTISALDGLGDFLTGLAVAVGTLVVAAALLAFFPMNVLTASLKKIQKIIDTITPVITLVAGLKTVDDMATSAQQYNTGTSRGGYVGFGTLVGLAVAIGIIAFVASQLSKIDFSAIDENGNKIDKFEEAMDKIDRIVTIFTLVPSVIEGLNALNILAGGGGLSGFKWSVIAGTFVGLVMGLSTIGKAIAGKIDAQTTRENLTEFAGVAKTISDSLGDEFKTDEVYQKISNAVTAIEQINTLFGKLGDTGEGNTDDWDNNLQRYNLAIEDSLDNIVEFGTKMNELSGKLVDVDATNFASKIPPMVEAVTLVAQFLDSLSGMDIEKKGWGVKASGIGVLVQASDTKSDTVFDAVETIGTKLSTAVNSLSTVGASGQTASQLVQDAINALEAVARFLVYINGDEIGDSIPEPGEFMAKYGVGSPFDNLLASIGQIGVVLSQNSSEFSEIDTESLKTVGDAITAISNILSGLGSVSFNASEFGKGLDPTTITEKISTFAQAVATSVSENQTVIADSASSFNSAGGDLANSLASGLSGSTAASDAAAGVARAAASKVDAFKLKFKIVGENLARGIGEGITAQTGFVEEAARAAVRAAKAAADGEGGISSPSKLMMETGKFLSLGMSVGIQKYGKSVSKASAGVTEDSIDSFNNMLSTISSVPDGIDDDPVIRPVVDMTNIRAASSYVDSAFSNRSFGLETNNIATDVMRRSNALKAASANQNGSSGGKGGNVSNSAVNFTNNNFTIRSEQDIHSLANELASLTRQQQRSLGAT